MLDTCPYCLSPIVIPSDDHVFPRFLEGRKTIACCKPCNDRFGHTFEGSVSRMIKAMRVSMRTWGLKLAGPIESWANAYEYEGRKFDISSDGVGTKLRLGTPIPDTSPDGSTRAVLFGSYSEAERAVQNVQRKGRSGSVETLSTEITFSGARFNFQIDRALYRTALKMCTAISVLDPRFSTADTNHARAVLEMDAEHGPVPNVTIAFQDYPSLDELRPPLSHVVYLERCNGHTQGVVQFFGVIQLFLRVGSDESHSGSPAIIGVLDSITGEEWFDAMNEPLGLFAPRVSEQEFAEGQNRWLRKFERSAVDRGAREPPNLSGGFSYGIY